MSADGLAPSGARTSANTVMTSFRVLSIYRTGTCRIFVCCREIMVLLFRTWRNITTTTGLRFPLCVPPKKWRWSQPHRPLANVSQKLRYVFFITQTFCQIFQLLMKNAHVFLRDLVWNRVLFKCHLSKQADDDIMFSYTSYWYIQLFSHVLLLKTKSHNSDLQEILNMMCFAHRFRAWSRVTTRPVCLVIWVTSSLRRRRRAWK